MENVDDTAQRLSVTQLFIQVLFVFNGLRGSVMWTQTNKQMTRTSLSEDKLFLESKKLCHMNVCSLTR